MNNGWWRSTLSRAVALVLGIGLLAILWIFSRPLAILILSFAIAASLAPPVSWLGKWLPRAVGVVIVYLVVVLALVGIGWLIIPPLVNEAQELSARAPELVTRAQELLSQWGIDMNNLALTDTLTSQIGNLGSLLITIPLRISSSLFGILLVLFISLYALIEAPRTRQFLLSLFKQDSRGRIDGVLKDMMGAMGGYVRGVVLDSLVVGILTYVGLLIIGTGYPLVLGLLAGLLELIPVLGPIIGAVIIVGITLVQSPESVLAVAIFVILLQQFENHILVPNIMHSQTNISPLLVVLALFAGGAVGGLLGALAAIPLAAALNVFVQEVVAPVIRSRTGAADEQKMSGRPNEE